MAEFLLLGGGGHARVVVSVLNRIDAGTVIGYTDQKDRGRIAGVPYLGSDEVIATLVQERKTLAGVLGLGNVRDPVLRRSVAEHATATGLSFPVIASPTAVVNEGVSLAAGTIVLDGAVVNVDATTGTFCIINSNATVEHDCRLGDFVHVAPGATISGSVSVADNVLVGAGAVVMQSIAICSDVIVGAGAVVIREIDEPGVYVGNPARRVRERP